MWTEEPFDDREMEWRENNKVLCMCGGGGGGGARFLEIL
jgi:hypothetical protein